MNFFDLLIVLVLSIISLYILRWGLASILSPLKPVFHQILIRARNTRDNSRLKQLQQMIEDNQPTPSISELEKIFYLSDFPVSRKQSQQWQEFNRKGLAILRTAPSDGSEIPGLIATCEELLRERDKLLKTYADTQDALSGLKKRKNTQTPEWATNEFQNKLSECCDELKSNSNDFFLLARKVISGQTTTHSSSQDITFH